METFKGRSFHTFYWPHEPVEMSGKKVAIIGTGATAIQIIGEIADKVGELTVFQRRPNWASPLNNGPISNEEMADIRIRYDDIFAACARSPGGFEHEPDRRGFYEVTREERLALWDRLYDEPGFGIWLSNFREIFTDVAANAEFSAYIADRIRQRVKDPVTAEKLIPKDHGFGVQRVPLETNYFEAYNRDNVHLVDISETPLERVTETGLRTTARDYDFDIIIYSTGFDAITGAFDQIDITGIGGEKLYDKWKDGPSTFLGMLVHGFPNLLMPTGPQSGSASTNFPRGIETGVNWCTDLLEHMWDRGYTSADPTLAAQERWSAHVTKMYAIMLMRKAKSWFTGYNSNIPGHEHGKVRYFVYNGGTPKYVAAINNAVANGYEDIVFTSCARPSMRPGLRSSAAE
jgi:cation diffusion facilitator CzcD-associated flavoprotein CzcO